MFVRNRFCSIFPASCLVALNQKKVTRSESGDKNYFDVVIIGNSISSTFARMSIKHLKPNYKILLVDPLNETKSILSPTVLVKDYVKLIDPVRKIVVLGSGETFKFGKCLIACGYSSFKLDSKYVDDHGTFIYDVRMNSDREKMLSIVKNGGHVTLSGSSWPVIKFSIYLSDVAERAGYSGSVTLVMPSYGPLSQTIPRYYSASIMMHLARKRIEVIPYTQLRFIGGEDALNSLPGFKQISRMAVFCSKTFDSLDSIMIGTDAVGLCFDSVPGTIYDIMPIL